MHINFGFYHQFIRSLMDFHKYLNTFKFQKNSFFCINYCSFMDNPPPNPVRDQCSEDE